MYGISNCLVIDDVKMHRTLCTNVIENVLCPHVEELTDDIDSNKCSLIIDERNDISIMRSPGISVMYISQASNKVESTYLGRAQLVKCDVNK